MEKLYFTYASHYSLGDNVTVRKGKKWAHRLAPGDTVELHEFYSARPPLEAKIVAVSCMRLCDIPRRDLRDHHDHRIANRMVAKSDRETPIKGDFQELCRQLLARYGSVKVDMTISVVRYQLVEEEDA